MELLAAETLARSAHIVVGGSEGGEMPGFRLPDYEAIKDAVAGPKPSAPGWKSIARNSTTNLHR